MAHKVTFPKDELNHPTIGEWWYYNGHLQSADGHRYSYMNCLFRARLPFVKGEKIKIPQKDIYFYHSMLTDIDNDKLYAHIDHLSSITKDSFIGPLLNVFFSRPRAVASSQHFYIEEPKQFQYRLKGPRIHLNLESQKEPLMLGGGGYIANLGKSTYYYSLTDLKTDGHIVLNNKIIPVQGQSWMDHQWADVMPGNDRWNWFAIQLSNHYEVLCYEYGRNGEFVNRAFVIDPNGRQQSLDELKMTRLDRRWTSDKTKAEYILDWQIEIPSYNLKLKIESLTSRHEMNYLTINYWEGPTKITGQMGDRDVSGHGYVEMVGRQSVLTNLRYARNQLTKLIAKKNK